MTDVRIRNPRLRHAPDPAALDALRGSRLQTVGRRAKYLLLDFGPDTLIVHLGMSGSLRIQTRTPDLRPHDHVILSFGTTHLVYHDPRRFGGFVLTRSETLPAHPLLAHLGPEPLSTAFSGEHLYRLSRNRRQPVKNFIMDQRVVVGVGNIYATEALFRAGIRPDRAAGRISAARYDRLAEVIRTVLHEALAQGGTTLRDFVQSDGKPGYFAQTLQAYGREGEPCITCGHVLRLVRLGGRASVFCPACQR
ncbi:bifunctional DNA-formamidopyrimidine glycosylase/DNA-(apurinic or apyrimidinic site) lyase [Hahella sp. SMD15-11]|uniref:Formamidopyrimidine-DNA glycosylase n=1 Tax=Thermohahella caldifontis TaxID=3142973 RepID=A0AB39V077_9GAMM